MGTCEWTAGTVDHSTRRAIILDIADPSLPRGNGPAHGPDILGAAHSLAIAIDVDAPARLFRPDASHSCPHAVRERSSNACRVSLKFKWQVSGFPLRTSYFELRTSESHSSLR